MTDATENVEEPESAQELETPEVAEEPKSNDGGTAPSGFKDETLKCVDCESGFTHSAEDQEYFDSKGYTNKPLRCETCRAAKKAERRDKDRERGDYNVCRQFQQRGDCDYGDRCRFSHGGGASRSGGARGGGYERGRGSRDTYGFGGDRDRHRDRSRSRDRNDRGGGYDRRDRDRGDRPDRPRNQGECFAFQKGNCDRGDSCRFKHVLV